VGSSKIKYGAPEERALLDTKKNGNFSKSHGFFSFPRQGKTLIAPGAAIAEPGVDELNQTTPAGV